MTAQSNVSRTISLWRALTAIAVASSTLAGAAWVAGRAYLQDELSQYKEAENWKAPDAIRKISALSSKLDQQIAKMNDYEALKQFKVDSQSIIDRLRKEQRETVISHKKVIDDLNKKHAEETADILKQLSHAETRIASLTKITEELRGEEITILAGQAKPVGHKTIRVGVQDTSDISNWAEVSSGDFSSSIMKPGDNFSRIVDSKRYVITLVKVSRNSCSFSYDVFDSNEP